LSVKKRIIMPALIQQDQSTEENLFKLSRRQQAESSWQKKGGI